MLFAIYNINITIQMIAIVADCQIILIGDFRWFVIAVLADCQIQLRRQQFFRLFLACVFCVVEKRFYPRKGDLTLGLGMVLLDLGQFFVNKSLFFLGPGS
jgi:hypothetical protein